MRTWHLQWHGNLTLWQGLLLAAPLCLLIFWLYQRELKQRKSVLAWLLPALRATALLLLVLMFTGPAVHYRQVFERRSRVLVFVDGSESMTLSDSQMENGRKLQVLDRMGLLPANTVDPELAAAAHGLGLLRRQIESALAAPTADVDAPHLAKDVTAQTDSVLTHLKSVQADKLAADPAPGAPAGSARPLLPAMIDRFRADLVTKGTAGLTELAGDANRTIELRRRLKDLAQAATTWQQELNSDLNARANALAADGSSPVAKAVEKFDQLPRLRRVEALLLEGSQALLGKLCEHANVELWALEGADALKEWTGQPGDALPSSLGFKATGVETDLADPVRAQLIAGEREDQHQLAILFSDGQNNAPTFPKQMATELRGRVPIYTVTMGSTFLPKDLAIFKVEGPDSVFHKDRIKGQVTLKDDMPEGLPFTLKIDYADHTVWSKALTTIRKSPRTVDYEFPVEDLAADYIRNHPNEFGARAIVMTFKVSLTGLEAQHLKGRQTADLLVPVVRRKRQILLLDGRPRWEFRYLRNAFERDDQWETNSLVAGVGPAGQGWPRGDRPGTYPRDKLALFNYDLVVIGDVPRSLFSAADLDAIKEFVETRGGGVVFIDGPRGNLRRYAKTPIEELIPVEWNSGVAADGGESVTHVERATAGHTQGWAVSAAAMGRPNRLHLTEDGVDFAPLALVSEVSRNTALWESFQPPHWVAVTRPLPGAEVLMEAVYNTVNLPVIVTRRVGDGRVVYIADDESWRMRYQVADQYHPKYWKQLADWIAQPPSAGRDRYVSIEAPGALFKVRDRVPLRIRIKNDLGRPWSDAEAEVVLTRDGQPGPAVKLEPQPNNPGLYQATCPPLPAGRYEVAVRIKDIPADQMKARAEFTVQSAEGGEMAVLNADEAMMQAIAANSGGESFGEDDAADMLHRLPATDHSIVQESDLLLWNSWYWFGTVLGLLAIEWTIRKRSGMM